MSYKPGLTCFSKSFLARSISCLISAFSIVPPYRRHDLSIMFHVDRVSQSCEENMFMLHVHFLRCFRRVKSRSKATCGRTPPEILLPTHDAVLFVAAAGQLPFKICKNSMLRVPFSGTSPTVFLS
jgi:hypothetical protein